MENNGNTEYNRNSILLSEPKCYPPTSEDSPTCKYTKTTHELTKSESIAYEQALGTIYERISVNVEDIITR